MAHGGCGAQIERWRCSQDPDHDQHRDQQPRRASHRRTWPEAASIHALRRAAKVEVLMGIDGVNGPTIDEVRTAVVLVPGKQGRRESLGGRSVPAGRPPHVRGHCATDADPPCRDERPLRQHHAGLVGRADRADLTTVRRRGPREVDPCTDRPRAQSEGARRVRGEHRLTVAGKSPRPGARTPGRPSGAADHRPACTPLLEPYARTGSSPPPTKSLRSGQAGDDLLDGTASRRKRRSVSGAEKRRGLLPGRPEYQVSSRCWCAQVLRSWDCERATPGPESAEHRAMAAAATADEAQVVHSGSGLRTARRRASPQQRARWRWIDPALTGPPVDGLSDS